jgi:hypothetical protein
MCFAIKKEIITEKRVRGGGGNVNPALGFS